MEFVEKIKPQALPGRVIVQFPEADLSYGSLVLPGEVERVYEATVVSVGKGTDKAEELFAEEVKEGDKVIANPIYGDDFAITEVDDSRTKYKIYRMFEIVAKVPTTEPA